MSQKIHTKFLPTGHAQYIYCSSIHPSIVWGAAKDLLKQLSSWSTELFRVTTSEGISVVDETWGVVWHEEKVCLLGSGPWCKWLCEEARKMKTVIDGNWSECTLLIQMDTTEIQMQKMNQMYQEGTYIFTYLYCILLYHKNPLLSIPFQSFKQVSSGLSVRHGQARNQSWSATSIPHWLCLQKEPPRVKALADQMKH